MLIPLFHFECDARPNAHFPRILCTDISTRIMEDGFAIVSVLSQFGDKILFFEYKLDMWCVDVVVGFTFVPKINMKCMDV